MASLLIQAHTTRLKQKEGESGKQKSNVVFCFTIVIESLHVTVRRRTCESLNVHSQPSVL